MSGFLQSYQGVLEKGGLFLAVFVFSGLLVKILLHRLIRAFDPDAARMMPSDSLKRATVLMLAGADLIGWLFAFLVASESVELHWFNTLVALAFRLLFDLIFALGCILLAYSFSKESRELILSLLGHLYLHHGKHRFDPNQEVDLGDGMMGKPVERRALHTVFVTKQGVRIVRNNASLMRELSGLGRS